MKRLDWMLLTASAAGLAILATLFLRHRPVTTADWASWVQAVGSVLAIFSVVWLARQDHHKKIEEEHTKALVSAHSVRVQLESTRDVLQHASHELLAVSRYGFDWTAVRKGQNILQPAITILEGAPFPTEEQLLRLASATGGLARTLALTAGLTNQCRTALRLATAANPRLGPDEIANRAGLAHAQIEDARARLDEAMRGLDQFIK